MNYKSKIFFITLFSLLTTLFAVVTYLKKYETINNTQKTNKNILIETHALPDLAISTEAMYIRHRSLSDIFSLFKESPSLLEYFPTSFVYNFSSNINNTPSKILNEK